MDEPTPPKRRPRLSLSEMLTVDDLINFVAAKARTRRGRMAVTGMSLVLLAAIVFTPIVLRSNDGAGPSSTPAVPVVTTPPTTDGLTTREQPIIPLYDSGNDKGRYGPAPAKTTPATAPPVTAAPAPAPTAATLPPATAAPAPAPTPATFPPATFPPSPPPTSPPLTVPQGPIYTP